MASVSFRSVDKTYPDGTRAVRDLALEIGDGELIVLVGPSGCGKTTALRMVAGLEEITAGEIAVGTRVINEIEPSERDIAMVFQNYALYPHMSVYDNMAFPLKLRGLGRAERDQAVRRVARVLGIDQHLARKPKQLSGGQRQRVAMGRAIVRAPQVFLMDEPLSNLDAKLRVQMRAEISRLQRELAITTIYVTHDQVEAMTIGDRVAVMRRGLLQQVAPPQQMYDRPANLFVAGFVGSPPMNFVEGELRRDGDICCVVIGSQQLIVDAEEAAGSGALSAQAGRPVIVGIRPESLVEPGADSGGRRIRGQVRTREALGSDALIHFAVDGARRLSRSAWEQAHDVEDPAETEAPAASDKGLIWVGRFAPRTAARPGESIDVAAAPGALRFFDPDSGRAIA